MDLQRTCERALVSLARLGWPVVARWNRRFERASIQPAWAPAPLLKRRERTFPQLGWPRTTDYCVHAA
jgi:hypothetical protein